MKVQEICFCLLCKGSCGVLHKLCHLDKGQLDFFFSNMAMFCCGYNLADSCTCKKILTICISGNRLI